MGGDLSEKYSLSLTSPMGRGGIMVAIDLTKVAAATAAAKDRPSEALGEFFAELTSIVEGARTLEEATAAIAAARGGLRSIADAAAIGGAGAVLALASGTSATAIGAPAPVPATPVPTTDPRLDALATRLGISPDHALGLIEGIGNALSTPGLGVTSGPDARAKAAKSACEGIVKLVNNASPPGTVLPDGSVSMGPALSAPSGVSKADHDAVVADLATAKADLATAKADHDAVVADLATAKADLATAGSNAKHFLAIWRGYEKEVKNLTTALKAMKAPRGGWPADFRKAVDGLSSSPKPPAP
jgi:hypothetical protein